MENLKNLKQKKLKEVLKTYKKVYTLGLSGPDIFFYNVLDTPLGKRKPGEMIHLHRTNRFFRNMITKIEELDQESRKIGIAYFTGFVGHYLLDVHCHPFVYASIDRTKKKKEAGEHFMLEWAMDVYFCQKYYHKNPETIRQTKLIQLSGKEKKVICELMADTYNRTFQFPHLSKGSLRMVLADMPIVLRGLWDRFGWKETILRFLEQKMLGYPFLSPLFVNGRRYGFGQKEFQIFYALYQKGLTEYSQIMEDLEQFLCRRGDNRVKQEILRKLQNRSYHTGKECDN